MRKILFLTTCIFALARAATPTGAELLEDVISHMNPESAQGIMTQTIVTTSGDERVLTYETFSNENGKNSMMRYLSPSRVRGNAMLMKNYSDDIWMFNKRTRRVRKLASHAKKQKFEGSDFTYEDMGSGDSWQQDFIPKNMGTEEYDNTDCYVLELTAKNNDVSYSKIVAFLRTGDNFPLKIDYYDENENLKKSLFLENIQTIQGIPTAMKMTMKNQQDNTSTRMEYEEVEYGIQFKPNFFSERNLKN